MNLQPIKNELQAAKAASDKLKCHRNIVIEGELAEVQEFMQAIADLQHHMEMALIEVKRRED